MKEVYFIVSVPTEILDEVIQSVNTIMLDDFAFTKITEDDNSEITESKLKLSLGGEEFNTVKFFFEMGGLFTVTVVGTVVGGLILEKIKEILKKKKVSISKTTKISIYYPDGTMIKIEE